MDKTEYLDAFRWNQSAILAAAELGLDPPVKGCPGWDVGTLTAHLGGVYTVWLKWIRERPRGSDQEAMGELAAEREARLPGYGTWRDAGFPVESRPSGILEFGQSTGDEIEQRLNDLQSDDSVWTFIPTDHTAGFIFRRIAHETAVHRWDAEQAHGRQTPIQADLARDGLEEFLAFLPFIAPPKDGEDNPRTGQRILLREIDTENCRLVTCAPDGVRFAADPGVADVTIMGSASDLMLFAMGRLTPDEMTIEGARDLAGRWGDLAARF